MSAQVGNRGQKRIAVGVLLAIVWAAGGCGGLGSGRSDPAARRNPEFPPALQALVAKMRGLHVTSERYRQSTSALVHRSRRTETLPRRLDRGGRPLARSWRYVRTGLAGDPARTGGRVDEILLLIGAWWLRWRPSVGAQGAA